MTETWDAIVIGSGIGGMTAAAALARIANKRVLVLEKHYERGGQTHVFRRDGASWDVGVHYVSSLGHGSRIQSLFEFLSGDQLVWNKMPDDYDRFIYPDFDFAVPSDPTRYQQRLIERFPKEEAAIRRYFVDLQEVTAWRRLKMMQDLPPPWPLGFLLSLWTRRGDEKATQTTKEYLDKNFQSPEIKSLLATIWQDYGLPPGDSAFVQHAVVSDAFGHGAWFPQGGAGRIARAFETTIEAYGGAVRVCREATSILTDKYGRVTGVKALDLRGPEPTEVVYNAPIVISNVGAPSTYNKLLPTNGEIGQRTAAVRDIVDKFSGGASGVVLYLRLEKPVSTIGLDGGNCWVNSMLEHGSLESQTEGVLAGKPQHVFLSFPSMKSGDDRYHTAEILALVSPSAFSAWRKTDHATRGIDYLELKERISQGLLDLAETGTPGLKALVTYSELSTPLSMEDYTSHPSGTIYGLDSSPGLFLSSATKPSPIPGLYLSGTDAWGSGVVGALMGGVVAAGRVLGSLGFLRIMKAAASQPPSLAALPAVPPRSSDKKRAIVLSKTALNSLIWKMELELDMPIEAFAPGQFAMLMVAPFEWRSYSIAAVEDRRLTLLISTRTGGDGSIFVNSVKPGTETKIELPFGAFRLRQNNHQKVFIATGTGIAPFVPMFAALADAGQLDSAELLFGCRFAKDDITSHLSPLPRKTTCVSGDPSAEGVVQGRVTKVVDDLTFDASTTDFYLCGSPAMIKDCRDALVRAGATNILTEVY